MIRWEAALVAVLGGIVGVALGVVFGWAAVGALGSRFDLNATIPIGQLLAYLVVAGVAGLLAGVLPAPPGRPDRRPRRHRDRVSRTSDGTRRGIRRRRAWRWWCGCSLRRDPTAARPRPDDPVCDGVGSR